MFAAVLGRVVAGVGVGLPPATPPPGVAVGVAVGVGVGVGARRATSVVAEREVADPVARAGLRAEPGVARGLGVVGVEVVLVVAGLDEDGIDTNVRAPVEGARRPGARVREVGDGHGQRAIGEHAVPRRLDLQLRPCRIKVAAGGIAVVDRRRRHARREGRHRERGQQAQRCEQSHERPDARSGLGSIHDVVPFHWPMAALCAPGDMCLRARLLPSGARGYRRDWYVGTGQLTYGSGPVGFDAVLPSFPLRRGNEGHGSCGDSRPMGSATALRLGVARRLEVGTKKPRGPLGPLGHQAG